MLKTAIDSVIAQTISNWELIIILDQELGLEVNDARIKVLVAGGTSEGAKRNLGINAASGKYISKLSADDTYEPSFLEEATAALESGICDVVTTDYRYGNKVVHYKGVTPAVVREYIDGKSSVFPPPQTNVFHIDLAKAFPLSDEVCSDLEWNLKVIRMGCTWKHIPKVLYSYGVGTSVFGTNSQSRSALIRESAAAIRKQFMSKAPYMIVTAYTPEYTEIVTELIASLNNNSLPFKAYKIESRGSWIKNVDQKPSVIHQALEEFPSHNILWLDADAVVYQPPRLLESIPMQFECAAYYHRDGTELVAGTVFIRNSKRGRAIVEAWCQAIDGVTWDQKLLQAIVSDEEIYRLPESYNQIFDSKSRTGVPVILQNQASRKMRRTVKATVVTDVEVVNGLPCSVYGIRAIPTSANTFKLIRYNKSAIDYCDRKFIRIGQDQWRV